MTLTSTHFDYAEIHSAGGPRVRLCAAAPDRMEVKVKA